MLAASCGRNFFCHADLFDANASHGRNLIWGRLFYCFGNKYSNNRWARINTNVLKTTRINLCLSVSFICVYIHGVDTGRSILSTCGFPIRFFARAITKSLIVSVKTVRSEQIRVAKNFSCDVLYCRYLIFFTSSPVYLRKTGDFLAGAQVESVSIGPLRLCEKKLLAQRLQYFVNSPLLNLVQISICS